MLVKIPLFLALFLFAEIWGNVENEIANLEKNFAQGNFDDVLLEGEALKKNNFNNIALREILLRTYLEKNFLNQAKRELEFMKKWTTSDKVDYLEALVAFYEKNYPLSLSLLNALLLKNSFYQDAYLLRARIFTEQRKYFSAQKNLNEYETIAGKTMEWYRLRGTLITRQMPVDLTLLRRHLDEFRGLYPKDSDFLFLESQFYLLAQSPNKALNSINAAIDLRENYFPYIKKKLEIYFLYKNWRPLLAYLKKQRANNEQEFAYYKKLEVFVQLLLNRLGDSLFTLANKNNLNQVILPLEELILRNENDEWSRFFLEELILANTTLKNPLREKYASYHYALGNVLQKKGNYEGARSHFRKGIKLSPLDINLRMAYATYLRNTERLKDYLEELKIIERLNRSSGEMDDFKVKTQIELLEKELNGSLDQALVNNFTPKHQVNVHIILKNRPLKDEFDNPYFDVVLGKMLLDKLLESFLFKVEFLWQKEIKRNLSKDNAYNHNFLVNYAGQDEQAVLKFDFSLMNLAEELKKQSITSRGNQRYRHVLNRFKISLEENLLPQGEIVEVSSNEVTISLGKLHGLKSGDKIRILSEGRALGEVDLMEVADYFATAQVLDYALINSIKKGHVVQFIK